ncbi:hypothetical protein H0H87_008420 [Tephrocybe sp. NHM501043]|nr:hypothetical protein H0H87_008420 [Tephrocybe sp. NHM501043]
MKKSKKLGKASEHIVAAALNISGGIAEIATGIPLSGLGDMVTNIGDFKRALNKIFDFKSKAESPSNITQSDLQDVFRGAPGAKYDIIIQALLLQWRKDIEKAREPHPQSTVDYRALVAELLGLRIMANYPSVTQAAAQSETTGIPSQNNALVLAPQYPVPQRSNGLQQAQASNAYSITSPIYPKSALLEPQVLLPPTPQYQTHPMQLFANPVLPPPTSSKFGYQT